MLRRLCQGHSVGDTWSFHSAGLDERSGLSPYLVIKAGLDEAAQGLCPAFHHQGADSVITEEFLHRLCQGRVRGEEQIVVVGHYPAVGGQVSGVEGDPQRIAPGPAADCQGGIV